MADRTTVATRAFILLLLCYVVGVEEEQIEGAPFFCALVSCGGKVKFINRMKGSTVLFLRLIKVSVRWEVLLRLGVFGNNARR